MLRFVLEGLDWTVQTELANILDGLNIRERTVGPSATDAVENQIVCANVCTGKRFKARGAPTRARRRGTKRDTCPAKLRRGFNVGPVVQQYSSDGVVASLRLSTKHKSHRRNDVSDERTHDNNKDSMPCVFDNNIRVCVPQESTV